MNTHRLLKTDVKKTLGGTVRFTRVHVRRHCKGRVTARKLECDATRQRVQSAQAEIKRLKRPGPAQPLRQARLEVAQPCIVAM